MNGFIRLVFVARVPVSELTLCQDFGVRAPERQSASFFDFLASRFIFAVLYVERSKFRFAPNLNLLSIRISPHKIHVPVWFEDVNNQHFLVSNVLAPQRKRDKSASKLHFNLRMDCRHPSS